MIFVRPFVVSSFLLLSAKPKNLVAFARASSSSSASFSRSFASSSTSIPKMTLPDTLNKLQDIIGTDAGDRGMKSLIVPGDLRTASEMLGQLEPTAASTVVVLSGFPCCVTQNPPTETDGPPGTFAIARCAAALGHAVVVVVDNCNEAVFAAALRDLAMPDAESAARITLQAFSSVLTDAEETRFQALAAACDLLISCERAGPAQDGNCYTMRGINMNAKGLIAPLHRFVKESNSPYLAIGDGGNELGMGKVLDAIIKNPKIADGEKIGCAVPADYLVAASVSNWGGYALAAGAAVVHANEQVKKDASKSFEAAVKEWVGRCLPSDQGEVALLDRCVAAGCRDGVSGEMEATVDGMPLETSLQCLRDLRAAALSVEL